METYDFASKHLYRQRRENAIDKLSSAQKFRDRKVAYLDTCEALDTIAYLKRGYRPQNLWAINRDPLEVTLLLKALDRQGYPPINIVGMEFEKALEQKVPEVSIIDFDGMSCLHSKLIESFKRIVKSRPLAVYGVTLLAARETEEQFKLGEWGDLTKFFSKASNIPLKTPFGTELQTPHDQRIFNFWVNVLTDKDPNTKKFTACHGHITRLLWDSYMSISNQPMVWAVCNLVPHSPINLNKALSLMSLGGMALCQAENLREYAKSKFSSVFPKPLSSTEEKHLKEIIARNPDLKRKFEQLRREEDRLAVKYNWTTKLIPDGLQS